MCSLPLRGVNAFERYARRDKHERCVDGKVDGWVQHNGRGNRWPCLKSYEDFAIFIQETGNSSA